MNRCLATAFALLLPAAVSACSTGRCPDGRSWSTPAREEADFVRLINAARLDEGLSALTYNTTLRTVAFDHSKDMACRNFFDHINPEGQNPADRVAEAGNGYAPPYRDVAENIGTSADAQAQFDGWMASEGHRRNILKPDDQIDELGVGLVHITEGSDHTDYWTAVFLGRHR